MYLRARTYNPANGRFSREDPARDGNNWYAYANGNPVAYSDPSGLMSIGDLREEYYNPGAYEKRKGGGKSHEPVYYGNGDPNITSHYTPTGKPKPPAHSPVYYGNGNPNITSHYTPQSGGGNNSSGGGGSTPGNNDVFGGAGNNWVYHPQGGGYGDRSMYSLPAGATSWHAGLDLYTGGQRIGTPLYSAWHGTVVDVPTYNNEKTARGNYVVILLDEAQYGAGIYVLMQHMEDVAVLPGTKVRPGDIVGTVGNSGVGSESGHLHLEIMVGGITTNPNDPTSSNYYSIDPVNDSRAQEILRTYSPAW